MRKHILKNGRIFLKTENGFVRELVQSSRSPLYQAFLDGGSKVDEVVEEDEPIDDISIRSRLAQIDQQTTPLLREVALAPGRSDKTILDLLQALEAEYNKLKARLVTSE